MFSQGQIIFAICFLIVFIVTMVFVYRKDIQYSKFYYKGVKWVLLSFLLFIGLLFLIKFFIKD